MDNMENWITHKCPYCGAGLRIHPKATSCKCPYCDNSFTRDVNVVVNELEETDVHYNEMELDNQRSKNRRKTITIVLLILLSPLILGTVATIIGVIVLFANPDLVDEYSDDTSYSSYSSYYEEQERSSITRINPFDKIEIKYYGESGRATASGYDRNDWPVSDIKKEISRREDLKNGDEIIVTLTVSDETKALLDKKNIQITETSKTYTVEGLDEYITDISQLSNTALTALRDTIDDAMDKELFFSYDIDRTNCDYQVKYREIGWISYVTKTYSSSRLYLIYEVTFSTSYNNLEDEVIYIPIYFSNAMISSDGNCSVDSKAHFDSGSYNLWNGKVPNSNAYMTWYVRGYNTKTGFELEMIGNAKKDYYVYYDIEY